jgi:hypothetical protein
MKKVLTIALLVISFLGFITACETISHDPLVESPQANVSHQNADLSSVVAKTNPNERAAASPSVTIPFNGNYTSSSDAVKWYNKTGSTAHKAYATLI